MDAAFMSLERHGWDIHVLSGDGGHVTCVTAVCQKHNSNKGKAGRPVAPHLLDVGVLTR